ncbi:MAG: hypothetical protein QGF06_04110 [Acidimicrobiales bacterium]|nr:hypothetical protein [Acidimicrobiales bacterium]
MDKTDFRTVFKTTSSSNSNFKNKLLGKLVEVNFLSWMSAFSVFLSCFFVLWILNPEGVLFKLSTPTGGDLGAHVWGPAFLRDELIPNLRLSGWAPDWYAGFPAYHFYMVVPMLFIVVLNTGLVTPFLILLIGLISFAVFKLITQKPEHWKTGLFSAICLLLLIIPFHYGLAFKLVVAVGLVLMPFAGWKMGRLASLPEPAPALLGVSTLAFIFDRSFNIMGGNLMSTMAGEFAFTLAITSCLIYIGLLIKGVETGEKRALAALFLALTGLCHLLVVFFALLVSFVAVATRLSKASIRWITEVGLLSGLLSAFWVIPFWWHRSYLNDMGWEKLTSYTSYLWSRDQLAADFLTNDPPLQLAIVLAGVGAVLSLMFRRRLGVVLAISALALALAFIYLPEGRLYNGRLLPAYYLSVYLLAAMAIAEIIRILGLLVRKAADGKERIGDLVSASIGFLVVVLFIFYLAVPLRVLPGGKMQGNAYQWMGYETEDLNIGRSWALWNFEGYEARTGDSTGGGWEELVDFVITMDDQAREHGCGRLMWEYSSELTRYGTPMAPMLIPHWTDGCVGSMEGLYFESSTTTPFHFLIQSELSTAPSRAQRDLPYRSFDINAGIDHLQQFGVKYYASSSQVSTGQAQQHPSLTEIAKSGPWTIFKVSNSELVTNLDFEPAIFDDLEHSEWLNPSVEVFQEGSQAVVRTIGGMKHWQHVDLEREPERIELSKVKVSEINVETDRIEFEVDKIGVPVIVKTSYFPNWKAKGAEGPWRATPNLMVVVPTEKEVALEYGRSSVEIISVLLTLTGLVSLAFVGRKPNSLDFSSSWFDSNSILPDIDKTLNKWSKNEYGESRKETSELTHKEVQL